MISVLTVNYYSSEDIVALAESLLEGAPGHDIELIVVNNSAEDRIDRVDNAGIHMIVQDSANIGFAAGINLAKRRAGGDVFFVTNPDVRVTPGSLDAAVAYLRDHPDVGIVLPLLRNPDGGLQLSVRRFYSWPSVFYARSPLRALGYEPRFFRRYLCRDLDRSTPVDVDWGLGGAMFLRAADFDGADIFDERFFLYFEDVDLCHRTWADGRRVVYVPRIECIHAHRRSSRIPVTRAGMHHLRSFLQFLRKYRGLPRSPRT